MKQKVLVIFGGKSAEHEVSIRSAKNIFNALDRNKFEASLVGITKEGTWYRFGDSSSFPNVVSMTEASCQQMKLERCMLSSFQGKTYLSEVQGSFSEVIDIAFPVLHGTNGEDGTIQGLFKMVQLPFVGCGVLSSAIGMDKEMMKRVLAHSQIPTAPYILLQKFGSNPDYETIVSQLGLPFFIKPANAGSSVGVHKIKNKESFLEKLKDAFQFDFKVLAEKMIVGRELECSVKGLNQEPKASLPGEVIPQHDFYSYEAKYLDDNGAIIQIPAKLSDAEVSLIQKMACATFTAMGCSGLTRVDFFLTSSGEAYVNEINTLPGFTQISMYPKMWEASGVSYSGLVSDLISLAFAQHKSETELKMTYLE